MDRTKSISSSIKNLEQLAELMLCKHFHNSKDLPEYSQVDEIRELWTSKVEEEHLRVKEERKRAAKLQARKELLRVKKNAIAMTDELEQDDGGRRGKKVWCTSYIYLLLLTFIRSMFTKTMRISPNLLLPRRGARIVS
jgi:hypothetical protein